ncbi:MAG: metallophosphoesterase, partial [Thermoplasmatota archaeon]
AGDLIETKPSKTKARFIQQQLRNIDSEYGVYAVDGNHELYGDNGKLDFFRNTNIHFLRDTVKRIDDAFYLVGRKDRHIQNRKSFDELLKFTPENLPSVVLDHQPYHLERTAKQEVDIQVSGHTHHGQMFPFNYITKAMYRISWGYEEIENTHFFVTCGAQGWGPPVKTSSTSEIMEINVKLIEEKVE